MAEMTAAAPWQPPSLRVVNPAADQLTFEQTLEQARQQGYQDGLKQGQEQGRQQARAMLAEMSALWDAMQQPFADMEHEVHAQLLGLSIAVAEAVLQRELKTDHERIRRALESALNALGTTDNPVDVELNPRDADLVSSLLADDGIEHRIKADPNIMPGGCRLRQGHALVDARIETLIAEAIADIAERSRLIDGQGSEQAPALNPEDIQAIAQRFAQPSVKQQASTSASTQPVTAAEGQAGASSERSATAEPAFTAAESPVEAEPSRDDPDAD